MLRRAIDLVEAAYRLADDEGAWLSAVLAAAEPTLADGLGCFATIYRRDAPTPAEMVSPYAVRGADTRLTDALREAFERTDDATRRLAFTIGRPVATLTDLHGVPPADNAAYRGLCRVIGFGDVLTVNAHNPDGTGCFLSAPLRASRRARASAWWSRLAAHVAAGLRLQLGLREEAVDAAEAVLTPGGTIVHATSTGALARRAIQQAARRAERARGALRRKDPETALAAWTALVEGRWSLLDVFESDGRRFVVAVPNPPLALDPRRLSAQERVVASYLARGQSNKLIAYTMGWAEGTVATRVASVLRKLGVRSRAAVASRYLAWMEADFEEVTVGRARLMVGSSSVAASPALTPVEAEVARLAVAGASNAAIARARGTSVRTVANQLRAVFAKLGVRSRAELGTRSV